MKLAHLFACAVGVTVLGACTDEKIVFENRAFNPPADAVNGFLGYFTNTPTNPKQTSCGNCHVVHQRDWVTTAHANAWAGLLTEGNPPQTFCTGCHTVSGKGNAVVGNAGYNRVPDVTYHDVQCESCHGPGFTHAETPDGGVAPLASIAVHIADSLGTCGECHSGTHHPFAEEWEQSRHAEAQPAAISNYVASPTTSTCVSCHEGRLVLKAWGVTANYLEKDDPVNATTALGITCSVCHNPHGSPYTKQLRYPIDTPDPAQNLCMKCHLNRTVPASGSSRGNSPHAPQGAVLLGEAGYVNGAYVDTVLLNASSVATHFSPTSNPRLCAGCHLFAFPTTDTAGTFNQATGHLFRPIPCYGADGLPTDTIQNCAFTPAARSFRACAASGCHSTQDQAALVYSVQRGRLQDLVAELWVDVDGDRVIDAYPVDTGMLARIKLNTTDLNPSAAPITAADGAEFNVRTFGEDPAGVFMYDNGDKSRGAHNPFYEEALLRASINELTALYGAQVWWTPPSPTVQRILDGPLGASGRVPFPQPTGRRTASR
jgi:predicted CXXCH cytochrome family protein